MSASNPNHTALFLLVIFCTMVSFKLSYCMGSNDTIFCPEIEKQSLLSFKRSFRDPSSQLSSWDGEVNCCKWKGVVCNNFTGHVYQLHLKGNTSSFPFGGLRGQINPSLLNLKHLRFLDLSQNEFFGETIPSFIGSITSLEFLNLSDAGFHGRIPHGIGNLSNLRTLDLESKGFLNIESLEWLSGLSKLEHLNMNRVNISRATNWPQVINSLPSLRELHFKNCSLNSMAPLNDMINITSLTFLDLSHNNFQKFSIPRWIFQPINLLFLDLSFNNFKGTIPEFSNATKLQYIDLSRNHLNSTVPDWLYFCKDLKFVHLSNNLLHGRISNAVANLTSLNTLDFFGNRLSGRIPREISHLCKLQFLFLTFNEFHGEISDSFGNMSECFLRNIILFCLRGNQLTGHILDQFGEFETIRYLHFGGNLFSGGIPISLGKLLYLEELSLYGNKFTGNLPESFGRLSNLEYLYIDDNKLEGIVTDRHFANLTKLKTFSASGNFLTLNVSPNWIPPFQLRILGIGSWNLGIGSPIPSWLETQKNILELDLSNTGVSGGVPSWFWKMKFLNLSHNHLHGKIAYLSGAENGWSYLYLSSNNFNGSLPRLGGTVRELDLSNNSFSGGLSHFLCDRTNGTYGLWILHLGGNNLSGELPDCWMKLPSLGYLNLGKNSISGNIPNSMGWLANLQSLNLYKNRLSGKIPFSMHNCVELVKIELADNDLDGGIPTWLGISLVKLKFLILRKNKFSGKISSKICHLNSLQILDLSDNEFSGIIPTCVHNFTAMATKRSLSEYDYSSSGYSGASFIDSALVPTKSSLLQYDTILSLVTNIDLSNNNLSGNIPKEFTRLVELRSLNLSGNHLTGLIPAKIGDMKQLESLDLSRNSLSGHIPNSLSLLSSLNHLNLSFNNFTGRIPESTQLLGLDASSFIGNNLCGPPLISNCSRDGDKVDELKEDNKGDESGIEWFYVFLSLGYAVGFSVVCTTLVLKKSWRQAYFELLEHMWDKLYLYIHIKWTSLRNS